VVYIQLPNHHAIKGPQRARAEENQSKPDHKLRKCCSSAFTVGTINSAGSIFRYRTLCLAAGCCGFVLGELLLPTAFKLLRSCGGCQGPRDFEGNPVAQELLNPTLRLRQLHNMTATGAPQPIGSVEAHQGGRRTGFAHPAAGASWLQARKNRATRPQSDGQSQPSLPLRAARLQRQPAEERKRGGARKPSSPIFAVVTHQAKSQHEVLVMGSTTPKTRARRVSAQPRNKIKRAARVRLQRSMQTLCWSRGCEVYVYVLVENTNGWRQS